jgi:hypothetical protein
MRQTIIYLILAPVIFVLMLLAPFGVRYVQQYGFLGNLLTQREAPPVYQSAGLAERAPTPAANLFVDEPAVGAGYILLDRAHSNAFDMGEIAYLDGRLAARGYQLRTHQGGDLAGALRSASAYIVITPLKSFTAAEVTAVTNFVNNGGRLLLVGDPTRFDVRFEETFFDFRYFIDTAQLPLNSLSRSFGLTFNGDYLYNTVENEGNYRNIIVRGGGFAEHPLTAELEQIVFYGSHSIQTGPGSVPLLMGDADTWSSSTDRPGGLNLAALGGDGRVLALGDLSFLTEPYYTVFDNSQFIARIADFLTTGTERVFTIADFPFLYQGPINLVYTGELDLGPDAFDEIIALQTAFRTVGKELHLSATPQSGYNTLYLGLYNQADEVAAILRTLNVELIIDPPLEAEDEAENDKGDNGNNDNGDDNGDDDNGDNDNGDDDNGDNDKDLRLIKSPLGRVQMSGMALIALHEANGRHHVIVLAASKDGLENSIDRLMRLIALDAASALEQCFLQGPLAFCPTDVSDEELEIQLETGGAPTPRAEQPRDDDEDTGRDDLLEELDANLQGAINLGQTVNGNLGPDQGDAWHFSGGPGYFDFIAQAESLDLVLELYNADNEQIAYADRTFEGGEERLAAVDIPDSGRYTIVIRDYFGEAGSYTLSVQEAEPPDLDAADQGDIELDETVSSALGFDERHAWTFDSTGPMNVDIILTVEPDSTLDPVLELYGPNGFLVDRVDRNLQGEGEELLDIELGAGEYTILVYDYFGEAGSYELTIIANEFGDNGGNDVVRGEGRIFILAADDGIPQTTGFTSAENIANLLTAAGYEATVWSSTDDGALSPTTLNDYDLLIWDSGDYRHQLSLFDGDTFIIFEYLESGGYLLLIGATPPLLDLLEPSELVTLVDIQFVGQNAALLSGFSDGQVVVLDQSYQVISADQDDISGSELFIAHGPASPNSGMAVGMASDEDNLRLAALLFPFTALPAAVQATLLSNLLAWFGL